MTPLPVSDTTHPANLHRLLSAPFHPRDLEWRVGRVSSSGKSASILVYVTSRAVQSRLDSVVGPHRWQNEYKAGPQGGVLCGLGLLLDVCQPLQGKAQRGGGLEWVWKWDGAENTKVESVKGGLSGSMKRAAVQWGVGRYLYRFPSRWLTLQEGYGPDPVNGIQVSVRVPRKGHPAHVIIPTIPTWALPEPPPMPDEAGDRHPTFESDRASFMAGLRDVSGGRVSYVSLADWMEAHRRPRPSQMNTASRSKVLDWLQNPENVSRIIRWKALLEAEKAQDGGE